MTLSTNKYKTSQNSAFSLL